MQKELPLRYIFWLIGMTMLPIGVCGQEPKPKVYLSEISPQTIGEQKEWFEFVVTGASEIDMSEWIISKNKQSKKKISDVVADLRWGQGVVPTNEHLRFAIADKGYFYWEKSPVTLPNNGGSVEIWNQNGEIIAQADYPATKAGTTNGKKYAEVWNYQPESDFWYPLLVIDQDTDAYAHTASSPNALAPTPIKDVKILINEVSPKHELGDFVELKLLTASPVINLKYLTIKHNGSVIFEQKSDWLIDSNQFIVWTAGEELVIENSQAKKIGHESKTLSAGSGTIEVILYSGTSWETHSDVVCWQDTKLSQTEAKRVEKLNNEWQGECVEIKDLIPNQSIAREINAEDKNQASDWKNHFNGSPGSPNQTKNKPPVAVITVQGKGSKTGVSPFYLNLTGADSYDPDGSADMRDWRWWHNDDVISVQENPAGFYINEPGTHVIKLDITDYSGAKNSAKTKITVTTKKKNPSVLEPELETDSPKKAKTSPPTESKKNTSVWKIIWQQSSHSPHWKIVHQRLTKKPLPVPKTDLAWIQKTPPATATPMLESNPRLDKLQIPLLMQPRIKKNIGLIWLYSYPVEYNKKKKRPKAPLVSILRR